MAEHSKEQDPRSQKIAERKKFMAEMTKNKRPRVRVTAGNDDMRKVLKHPNGVGFPKDGGSVEWPHDQFTRRRIKDGSVKVEEHRDEKQRDDKPDHNERRRTPSPSAEPA
jgi:hypothetical protein